MRVLIAVDNSPQADAAVHKASQLTQSFAVTPTVLTVVRREDELPEARALQARIKPRLNGRGPVQTRIRVGNAAEEIVREVNEGHYDLLILGDRSQRNLLARLWGSITQKVIEQVHVPVLVAKGGAPLPKKILLCDSGIVEGTLLNRLTRYTPELLAPDVTVTVLHVMSQISAGPGVPGQQLRADADELIRAHTPEGEILEKDLHVLEAVGVHSVTLKIRHGLVVDEIVAEAESGNYDLVVIGSHRHEGWGRYLLDNISTQVILDVDRPVLVIP